MSVSQYHKNCVQIILGMKSTKYGNFYLISNHVITTFKQTNADCASFCIMQLYTVFASWNNWRHAQR